MSEAPQSLQTRAITKRRSEQSVEVFEGKMVYVRSIREPEDFEFCAAADGTGSMNQGCSTRSAGEYETLQGMELPTKPSIDLFEDLPPGFPRRGGRESRILPEVRGRRWAPRSKRSF